jgi:molybdenum cofactor cytidylyltransferase
MHGLHGVLLAAGTSSRFGAPKPLAQFDGATLLERALRAACAVLSPADIFVVVGAHAERLRPSIVAHGAHAVRNERYAEGIGLSIGVGVAALPPTATAVLILLADQPRVTGDDLAHLVDAWRRHPDARACAHFEGVRGAPAIFPAADFAALRALRGDRGARALLREDEDGRPLVEVAMPHAAFDVDTPDDLARP